MRLKLKLKTFLDSFDCKNYKLTLMSTHSGGVTHKKPESDN